jgi:hypothetical protein
VKEATPAVLAIRDVLFTLAAAAHSVVNAALALSNQQNSPANDSNSGERITEVEPIEAKEETGVLIDNQEESSTNLKRRTPFQNAADDAEPQK